MMKEEEQPEGVTASLKPQEEKESPRVNSDQQ